MSIILPRHYRTSLIVLLILGFLSLLTGLTSLSFKGEEPLRIMVAYEMFKSGNFFQPTFLGEDYYKKPPMFNWLIIIASYVTGWSELTPRFVSIISLILAVLFTFILSYKFFKDINISTLSALIFLSCSDVLFWYGYLGEIDMTLTLTVLIMFYLLIVGHIFNKPVFILLSGIVTSLAFLLKGIPAYAFWGLTVISLFIFNRNIHLIKYYILTLLISFIIPILWLINTQSLSNYIYILMEQTFSRIDKGRTSLFDHILHVIEYLVLNIKQLIPHSIFFFILLLFYRRLLQDNIDRNIKLLSLIALINYIPYAISLDSQGRYILPLFPIISVIIAFYMHKIFIQKAYIYKAFLFITFVTIIIRFIYGILIIPYMEENKVRAKDLAKLISHSIKLGDRVACDCKYGKGRDVCVYTSLMTNKVLKTSRLLPEWTVKLECNRQPSKSAVYSFRLKDREFINVILR